MSPVPNEARHEAGFFVCERYVNIGRELAESTSPVKDDVSPLPTQ
jgi:hypothetical protein